MVRYSLDIPGKPASTDVAKVVEQLWQQLRSDQAVRDDVERAGVSREELDRFLADHPTNDVYEFKPAASGLGAVTTAVLVAFAPVAAQITQDLWEHFILPKLKERFGASTSAQQVNDDPS